VLPPLTLPLTALAALWSALQDGSAVAALPIATLDGPPPPPPYISNSTTRAALLPSLAGVAMLVRLPDTVTRFVHVVPSTLVSTVNAPVFQPVLSPARPECLTTNDVTFWLPPRSTWSVLVPAAVEHHVLKLNSWIRVSLNLDGQRCQGVGNR